MESPDYGVKSSIKEYRKWYHILFLLILENLSSLLKNKIIAVLFIYDFVIIIYSSSNVDKRPVTSER